MLLAVDDAVPHGQELFRQLGELVVFPAGKLMPEKMREVVALVLSSRTKLDEATIAVMPALRWVGTSSSGSDNIDGATLQKRGIALHASRGANSPAVADYCLTATGLWLQAGQRHIRDVRAGILGCGYVGERLGHQLRALGADVLVCDPLRADMPWPSSSLDELAGCDLVSLHVPLARGEPFATAGLYDAKMAGRLPEGGLLIQTSRGQVLPESALEKLVARGCYTAVDVWNHEPTPRPEHVEAAWLATPHIAGHSGVSRWRMGHAAAMACAQHFGLPSPDPVEPDEPTEANPAVAPDLVMPDFDLSQVVAETLRYGIPASLLEDICGLRPVQEELRRAMATQAELATDAPCQAFQQVREAYQPRLEISQWRDFVSHAWFEIDELGIHSDEKSQVQAVLCALQLLS